MDYDLRNTIEDSATEQGLRAESPYENMRATLHRRTLMATALFLAALWLIGIVFGFVGFMGERPAYLGPLTISRAVMLAAVLVALVAAHRRRLALSSTIMVVAVGSAVLGAAVFNGQPGIVSYVQTTANAVLAVQIAAVVVSSQAWRVSYSVTMLVVVGAVGAWYLVAAAPADREMIAQLIVIAVFLLAMVFVPGVVGARERSQLGGLLYRLAYRDSVTLLPNSLSLSRDLSDELHRTMRREYRLAIFGVSIHGLRRVNQRHGHEVGDQVLRQVAGQLRRLQSDYTVYRIPGSMFVVVPKGRWSPDQAPKVVEDIERVVTRPIRVGDEAVRLRGWLVGTIAPDDGHHSRRLVQNLQNAVSRLASPPPAGRIEWFDRERFRETERQFLIEESVLGAISHREFSAQCQPKLDLRTNTLHGGEVLARWNHPRLGTVSPAEFIPAIDNEGAMVRFSREMLRLARGFSGQLRSGRHAPAVVAVNLTASSLADPEMREILRDIAPSFAPAVLEVELTEDVFLMMDDGIAHTLSTLKAMGIRLALDDFGTGFSNLGYLQEINVDTVKIDKRFVAPLPGDESSAAIVNAIITMSHSFGIEVVAEGVETTEQREALERMGCDIIQGYHFARPLDGEALERFVSDARPEAAAIKR